MRYAVRLLLLGAVAWLTPVHALDLSECKQYGGTAECWKPVVGEWQYSACGEVGSFLAYEIAICAAQGGSWSGYDCQGLPPSEYRRPTSEDDIRAYSEDVFANYQGPYCEGPAADSFSWGGVFYSNNCSGGGGALVNSVGYETANSTTPFAVRARTLNGGECNQDVATNYSGGRNRLLACPGQDSTMTYTSGATPALCSLYSNNAVSPKQCNDCPALKVGNPIDPITGVKQHTELDYAGSGPQPLRFERVYHNRVYVVDGRQWRHNYSARIEEHAFGTHPVALAHRSRGRVFHFALNAGQYLPDADIDDRLTRLTDAGGALTGWTYYDAAAESSEAYDAEGRLLSVTSRAGLAQTLEYSTGATPPSVAPRPGLLIRVSDAFGRQLNFTYDALGRMASMQDPAGQSYLYTYYSKDEIGSMTFPGDLVKTVTYPGGKVRTYLYNEAGLNDNMSLPGGRLTGIIDENNSRFASYSYSQGGQAWKSEHSGGVNTVSINRPSWPSIVTVTDAYGTLRTYSYLLVKGVHRNTAIAQPAVSGVGTVSSTTTYDANGNPATRKDFLGNRTNYAFDLARNLETSRTEGLTSAGAVTPATRTIETQWHATLRLATLVAEKNGAGAVLRTTGMSYDANGNLLARTVTAGASSRTWNYTYNANGSVLTIDGPRTDASDLTTYTYYANDDADPGKRGNVATITNALGHLTEITAYNAHGQPLAIVDPNGLTTSLAYDLRQRLASRSVGAELTSYEYDGVGQLTKVTLPDGSHLAYTYDAAHRLTDITDSLGNRIAYTLDAMSNRTEEKVFDPLGTLKRTHARVYDSMNRIVYEIRP